MRKLKNTKKITLKYLKEVDACESGVKWWIRKGRPACPIKTITLLIQDNELNDANWITSRLLSRKNRIRYAVFAAEQVLHIFEKKYPSDKRPREAIEAAKVVIKEDNAKNKAAAAYAAAYDAHAAAYAHAAYAAAYAYAAYDAAHAAAYAYAAHAAAYAARKDLKLKILEYGIKLLEEDK